MFCARCGNTLSPHATTCGYCGTPVGGRATPKRPTLVTVLALLHLLGAAFGLLVGIVAVTSAGADSAGALEAVVGLVLLGLGVVQLACGIGLWMLKPWGRTLQIALAVVGLLGVPLGTIVSALILVYFLKPGVKVLFSGKPSAEFTAEEQAQVDAIAQGSLAAITVVLLVMFASVAALGVIAAVTIPGLLRARTAGNEASVIGSLRAINSAQATFAAVCGHGYYAPTLASLATPPPGESAGFVAGDLASDPSFKSQYRIALAAGDAVPDAPVACNGVAVVAGYFVSANPIEAEPSGARHFATNDSGVVFHSTSPIAVTHGAAPPNTTPVNGRP